MSYDALEVGEPRRVGFPQERYREKEEGQLHSYPEEDRLAYYKGEEHPRCHNQDRKWRNIEKYFGNSERDIG